ncbi:MAG: RsmD family RNA methyltransferase [Alphaproteobacteria bacterium]|nr:RsmD family RNA methyltransferase [Alphaproteobacteria bacterium]
MSTKILSGQLKGSVLVVPDSARPTLLRFRQSLFDMMVSMVPNSKVFFKDKVILDCFAGSGALGIESLSRGASFAYFVDISQEAIDVIYKNIQKLSLKDRCKIIKIDILKIRKFQERTACDIAFIDPPYGKVSIKKTLQHLFKTGWINENSLIVTEEDLSKTEDLSDITEIIIERNLGKSLFKIIRLKVGLS